MMTHISLAFTFALFTLTFSLSSPLQAKEDNRQVQLRVTLNTHSPESVELIKKNRNDKPVYLIRYSLGEKKLRELTLIKEYYHDLLSEIENVVTQPTSLIDYQTCKSKVLINKSTDNKYICFDNQDMLAKKRFSQWYSKAKGYLEL